MGHFSDAEKLNNWKTAEILECWVFLALDYQKTYSRLIGPADGPLWCIYAIDHVNIIFNDTYTNFT